MLINTSPKQRKYILLEFTQELIKNSSPIEVYELENKIKKEDKEKKAKKQLEKKEINEIKSKPIDKNLIKKRIFQDYQQSIKIPESERTKFKETDFNIENITNKKQNIQQKEPLPETPSPNIMPSQKTLPKQSTTPQNHKPIPNVPLPPSLQEIKPIPEKKEITLPKISNFINNPEVKEIQCNGPETNLIIKGVKGIKETEVILKDEELEEIINEFSKKTKIPIHPGTYKVIYGNLSFTTVISNIKNTRFLIKKLPIHQPFQNSFSKKAIPKNSSKFLPKYPSNSHPNYPKSSY